MAYIDKFGYKRRSGTGRLVHRDVAYNKIYKQNRSQYSRPFSHYVIHHVDGNKTNNNKSNLRILTKSEHSHVHGYDRYTEPSRPYLGHDGDSSTLFWMLLFLGVVYILYLIASAIWNMFTSVWLVVVSIPYIAQYFILVVYISILLFIVSLLRRRDISLRVSYLCGVIVSLVITTLVVILFGLEV